MKIKHHCIRLSFVSPEKAQEFYDNLIIIGAFLHQDLNVTVAPEDILDDMVRGAIENLKTAKAAAQSKQPPKEKSIIQLVNSY